MELTLTQETLMKLLKILNVDNNKMIAIMMYLKEEQQQLQMIQYIKKHQHATPSQIMKQLQIIIEESLEKD